MKGPRRSRRRAASKRSDASAKHAEDTLDVFWAETHPSATAETAPLVRCNLAEWKSDDDRDVAGLEFFWPEEHDPSGPADLTPTAEPSPAPVGEGDETGSELEAFCDGESVEAATVFEDAPAVDEEAASTAAEHDAAVVAYTRSDPFGGSDAILEAEYVMEPAAASRTRDAELEALLAVAALAEFADDSPADAADTSVALVRRAPTRLGRFIPTGRPARLSAAAMLCIGVVMLMRTLDTPVGTEDAPIAEASVAAPDVAVDRAAGSPIPTEPAPVPGEPVPVAASTVVPEAEPSAAERERPSATVDTASGNVAAAAGREDAPVALAVPLSNAPVPPVGATLLPAPPSTPVPSPTAARDAGSASARDTSTSPPDGAGTEPAVAPAVAPPPAAPANTSPAPTPTAPVAPTPAPAADAARSAPPPAPAAPPPPAVTTDARPSGPGVPAPAERAAPTSAANDERAVKLVLESYRMAYNDLNAAGAKAVWPSVDAAMLARAFDQLASQDIDFAACDVAVTGDRARAVCGGSAAYVPKVGSRSLRRDSRQWRFALERAGDRWVIARLETR